MNKNLIKKYLISFLCANVTSLGIGGVLFTTSCSCSNSKESLIFISNNSSNLYVDYGAAGNSGNNKISILSPINIDDYYFKIINNETSKKLDDATIKVNKNGQLEWSSFTKENIPPSSISVQLIKKNDKTIHSNKLHYSINLSLPSSIYKYDETDSNKLLGFTDEFLANPNEYSMCRLLSIPNNVTEVAQNAFYGSSTYQTLIPSFIKNLKTGKELRRVGVKAFYASQSIIYCDLSESEKIQSLGEDSFGRYEFLIALKLPNASNISISYDVFGDYRSLSTLTIPSLFSINSSSQYSLYFNYSQLQTIIFDGFDSQPSFDGWQQASFNDIAPVGWIYSTGDYDSTALLNDLKTKFGNTFNNWEAK